VAVGTFGIHPVTLYCSQENFMFIVDGDDCGEASSQLFGLYFPHRNRPDFIGKMREEIDRLDIR